MGEPVSVGMSQVSMMSLMPNGTPASGPRMPPRSSARACSITWSGFEVLPCEHLRLALLDALEARAHHFLARRLAGGDRRDDLGRGQLVQSHRRLYPLPLLSPWDPSRGQIGAAIMSQKRR